jgi:HAMP domain-containing protein
MGRGAPLERATDSTAELGREAMNGMVDARPPVDGTDGLNALLRGELAAVNAYQRALRPAHGQASVDAAEILRFASEHQRTVAALQGAVREMGGVPASAAGTWGAFALLRQTASVRELLEGEEAGLRMYEAVDEVLAGDARDLVTLELIPRQRQNIAELSAIIARLSA